MVNGHNFMCNPSITAFYCAIESSIVVNVNRSKQVSHICILRSGKATHLNFYPSILLGGVRSSRNSYVYTHVKYIHPLAIFKQSTTLEYFYKRIYQLIFNIHEICQRSHLKFCHNFKCFFSSFL